jgi:hypothetical protein
MDFHALYATDPKAEQEGREFDWGGGVKLKIARAHNPTYSRLLASQYETYKHVLEQKATEEDQAAAEACSNKIMAYVMARSLLLGWTGPVTYKGQPLPYSVANAEMLLSLKDFQNEVNRKANDFRNYRYETEAADEKNSPATSDGTSNGDPSSSTSSS